MKITLIGAYPPPYGGASVHVERLKQALLGQGVDVKVLAQPDYDGSDDGVTPKPGGGLSFLMRLFREDADILHYHTSGVNLRGLALLAGLSLSGKRIVVTLHSFRVGADDQRRRLFSLWPMLLGTFDHIICVGPAIRESLTRAGVKHDKTAVIPSYLAPDPGQSKTPTIDTVIDEFLKHHHPVITANAYRLVFHNEEDLYGLDMCVELCRQMVADYPQLGFVFALPDVGDDRYFKKIQQRLTDYQLNEHFCFSRAEAQYWPIIKRSTVLVRPTNTDSFGVSVAEAINLGVPAIASDVCERAEGTIIFRSRDLEDLVAQTRMVLDNLDAHKRRLADRQSNSSSAVDRIMAVYRIVLEAK